MRDRKGNEQRSEGADEDGKRERGGEELIYPRDYLFCMVGFNKPLV